eukprot:scaffold34601_cov234-Amphora_coffeaeformis.AAC.1
MCMEGGGDVGSWCERTSYDGYPVVAAMQQGHLCNRFHCVVRVSALGRELGVNHWLDKAHLTGCILDGVPHQKPQQFKAEIARYSRKACDKKIQKKKNPPREARQRRHPRR